MAKFKYEEVENYLRKYNIDQENPSQYDFNGLVHLMLAILDNLRESALDAELEDICYTMNDQHREFLQKIARYASRLNDAMIEAEDK